VLTDNYYNIQLLKRVSVIKLSIKELVNNITKVNKSLIVRSWPVGRHIIPDGVVDFGRTVYGSRLSVREMYEIDAILLAVDGLGQFTLLTVVNDDLVVFAA